MIIECQKNILLDNINIVARAVSSRTSLPILECILLVADSNGFRLMSNDLEMGIETANMEANIVEEGSVALEARIFSDIIRRLPEDNLKIKSDENNITVIKSGKSEFKILGMAGDEFPYLSNVEKDVSCTINGETLKNMIRQTIFSVAAEASKPVLTGELFEIKDNFLNVVAVDGFRISHRKESIETDILHSAVIPSKALNEISKIIGGDDEAEITMYFTERQVLFELPQCTMVSKLLDGEFIRYESVFTSEYYTRIIIGRHTLLDALERAALISSRKSQNKPVYLQIAGDNLIISTKTEMGTSFEELYIEHDGKDLDISFNPRFLMEVLRVIEEDVVYIHMTNQSNPCIIRGCDNEIARYLVLPLRYRE